MSWYPNNPVLRMLTPSSTCRPLEIYPVHLGATAISVDVTGALRRRTSPPHTHLLSSSTFPNSMGCPAAPSPPPVATCGEPSRSGSERPLHPLPTPSAGSTAGGAPTTRGGSDTSLENNNVYGLEPKMYVEGGAQGQGEAQGQPWAGGAACERVCKGSVLQAACSPCIPKRSGACLGRSGMHAPSGWFSAACPCVLADPGPFDLRLCADAAPKEAGVATAATLTVTVLAVLGVLVGGSATFYYFFGPGV